MAPLMFGGENVMRKFCRLRIAPLIFSAAVFFAGSVFAADIQVGNTIQNTNTQNITANVNFVSLYTRIPFLNKLLNPNAAVPKTAQTLNRLDPKKREMTLADTL